MRVRLLLSLGLLLFSCVSARAQVLVDDNFDSYLSDAEFGAVWRPDSGLGGLSGRSPAPGPHGIVVPRSVPPFVDPPFDGSGDAGVTPPVEPLVGQAITYSDQSGINEWDNDNDPNNVPFELVPDSTRSLKLTSDMFDFVNGNRRFSTGLRHDLDTDSSFFGGQQQNILELGYYNQDTFDPTDPTVPPAVIPTTGYAYRLAIFGARGGDLVAEPNWQYFQLPIEFDDPLVDHNGDGRFGNGDGIVSQIDVGPGWHRFSATITDTDVTFELDLFRDGTIDATQTWEIQLAIGPDSGVPSGFTSLRMGGPSNETMNQFTMVDNVRLEWIPAGISGDFDGNGAYECADVDALVAEIVAGTNDGAFDLTGDGFVNGDDLSAWLVEGGNAEVGGPFLTGDANLDGSVDVSDFNIWNSSKFTPTPAWCSGDFNADGSVDVSDFNVWNGNKFNSSAGGLVPEPSSFALLLWAAGLAWFRRRR